MQSTDHKRAKFTPGLPAYAAHATQPSSPLRLPDRSRLKTAWQRFCAAVGCCTRDRAVQDYRQARGEVRASRSAWLRNLRAEVRARYWDQRAPLRDETLMTRRRAQVLRQADGALQDDARGLAKAARALDRAGRLVARGCASEPDRPILRENWDLVARTLLNDALDRHDVVAKAVTRQPGSTRTVAGRTVLAPEFRQRVADHLRLTLKEEADGAEAYRREQAERPGVRLPKVAPASVQEQMTFRNVEWYVQQTLRHFKLVDVPQVAGSGTDTKHATVAQAAPQDEPALASDSLSASRSGSGSEPDPAGAGLLAPATPSSSAAAAPEAPGPLRRALLASPVGSRLEELPYHQFSSVLRERLESHLGSEVAARWALRQVGGSRDARLALTALYSPLGTRGLPRTPQERLERLGALGRVLDRFEQAGAQVAAMSPAAQERLTPYQAQAYLHHQLQRAVDAGALPAQERPRMAAAIQRALEPRIQQQQVQSRRPAPPISADEVDRLVQQAMPAAPGAGLRIEVALPVQEAWGPEVQELAGMEPGPGSRTPSSEHDGAVQWREAGAGPGASGPAVSAAHAMPDAGAARDSVTPPVTAPEGR